MFSRLMHSSGIYPNLNEATTGWTCKPREGVKFYDGTNFNADRELADRDEIYLRPLRPSTQALMSAVPVPDPDIVGKRRRILLHGDLSSPASPPAGCNFSTRCPVAREICNQQEPELHEIKDKHWVACHFAKEYL